MDKTRIKDVPKHYEDEIKRVTIALADAQRRSNILVHGKPNRQSAAKIAELAQAIRAGSYYRDRLIDKLKQARS